MTRPIMSIWCVAVTKLIDLLLIMNSGYNIIVLKESLKFQLFINNVTYKSPSLPSPLLYILKYRTLYRALTPAIPNPYVVIKLFLTEPNPK